jgi:hypothetical protein
VLQRSVLFKLVEEISPRGLVSVLFSVFCLPIVAGIAMADLESEEIMEGPRVSSAFEFGGTVDKPRTRDNFWYRALTSDSEPDSGLVIHVARRPRTKRGEAPHPTVRVLRPNPNGILYAKIRSGEVIVETEQQFVNRMMAMQEAGEEIPGMVKIEK